MQNRTLLQMYTAQLEGFKKSPFYLTPEQAAEAKSQINPAQTTDLEAAKLNTKLEFSANLDLQIKELADNLLNVNKRFLNNELSFIALQLEKLQALELSFDAEHAAFCYHHNSRGTMDSLQCNVARAVLLSDYTLLLNQYEIIIQKLNEFSKNNNLVKQATLEFNTIKAGLASLENANNALLAADSSQTPKAINDGIKALRDHAKTFGEPDLVKKNSVIALADSLQAKANLFYASRKGATIKANDFRVFAKDFTKELDENDAVLQKHRSYFRVLFANILLSLTVVYGFALAGYAIYKKAATGKAQVIGGKTKSKELADDIRATLISAAPAA